jgi:hypothetical protein
MQQHANPRYNKTHDGKGNSRFEPTSQVVIEMAARKRQA